MTPEERVEACLDTSQAETRHCEEYLLPKGYVARLIQMMEEAVAAERERCRQVVLKEAAFWRQEWKLREDREAQLFSAAAVVLASLITKPPE